MGTPPAASICIIREVPDRGRPETIAIMNTFRESSIVNGEAMPCCGRPAPVPKSPGTRGDNRARLSGLSATTRMRFLGQCAAAAAGAYLGPSVARATSAPSVPFPSEPRQRIAVASYPFREFIAGSEHKQGNPAIELKDFAAHVIEKFQVNKIEPWTGHFPSTDAKYLEQFRASLEKAQAVIVNIAVDGEHCPYAADASEREQAIAFSRRWVDAAVILGSPSIRTNIPRAKGVQPDLQRTADSLLRVAEHASEKNVVVNLEND